MGRSGSTCERVGAGHGESAQPAAPDVVGGGRDVVEHHLHLTGDQVGQRRRAAAVGHVHHVDAGHHLEQLARHVDRGAVAGRRHVELAGIGLGVGDQLGDRLDRKRRMDIHHVGKADDAGDRDDVAQKVETELVVERGVDGIGRRHQQQRVAVRRGAHDRLGGDIGAAAGPAFHHDRLAEPLRQPLPGEPRGDVGGAARGIADDQADRPRRVGLRPGPAR